MESAKGELIQLELKYCERCGGLWVRPSGSDLVFCQRCSTAMAGLLPRALKAVPLRYQAPARTSGAQDAFWVEGGNA